MNSKASEYFIFLIVILIIIKGATMMRFVLTDVSWLLVSNCSKLLDIPSTYSIDEVFWILDITVIQDKVTKETRKIFSILERPGDYILNNFNFLGDFKRWNTNQINSVLGLIIVTFSNSIKKLTIHKSREVYMNKRTVRTDRTAPLKAIIKKKRNYEWCWGFID